MVYSTIICKYALTLYTTFAINIFNSINNKNQNIVSYVHELTENKLLGVSQALLYYLDACAQ